MDLPTLRELLVGVPINAVLREKIELVERQYAGAIASNAAVQQKNTELQAENLHLQEQVKELRDLAEQRGQVIQRLEEELHRLRSGGVLDEAGGRVLAALAARGQARPADLAPIIGLPVAAIELHVETLARAGMAMRLAMGPRGNTYAATTDGKKYLYDRGLLT